MPKAPTLPPAAPAPSARDARIDVIRGLALAMIFVNHVPGNWLENFTSRNFGFTDAAEAFVMLAGVAAALAYSRGFHEGPYWPMTAKVWSRAWTLYLTHLMLSLAALAIVAAAARWFGANQLILQDNFQRILQDPLGVFIGLPLLLHQFGYVNILPLYAIFLILAPALIWLGLRNTPLLLAGSLALWAFAGLTRVNFLTYPGLNGWFLNPLSWQLLFVIGLWIGLRLKAGQRAVPIHPFGVALAAGYLLLALVWVKSPAFREFANQGMVALSRAGAPRLVTNFDKGHLELPRLLHILALAYIASALPGFARISARKLFWPLAVMGRQGLAVFALGTLLSFVARAIIEVLGLASAPQGDLWILAILVIGLALQIGFAALREASKRAQIPQSKRATPA